MRFVAVLLLSAWMSVASAEEVLFPVIDITVSSSVRVERHPTVREGLVEVLIRGCDADLSTLLTGRTNPYVVGMDATYIAGETWIIKAMMGRPDADLRVMVEDGRLVIDVVEADGGGSFEEEDLPTVKALVEGDAEMKPANTVFPPLMFLHGDAISYGMTSDDFVPLLPAPASMPRATWRAVDRARKMMLNATSKVALAQARYELGWLYLEKGFDREARYYFDRLAEDPGALPARDVALARARAALSCRDWAEARDFLREAYRYGARESAVVEGFGVISLATGVPSRSLTSQVLSRVTGRPEALLLAAELLQRDGYYKESRPLLEALVGRASGRSARQVSLRLGDARLLDGEYDAAVRAYRSGPKALGSLRRMLVELIEKGPAEWANVVPQLNALAGEGDEVGAEALYLLSQLDTAMGSQVDAVSDLSRLIRDHRRIAHRSDAPERLWSIYKERQERLLSAERWFDVAALHEGAWHPVIRRSVDDPDVLLGVSKAYEEIGLPHQALRLVREVHPLLMADGADDTALVFTLARLYGETGKPNEGMKAIRQYRSRIRGRSGEVALLAASLTERLGDKDGAVVEYRRAMRDPQTRDAASVELARIDAEDGRCKKATGVLWGRLMSPEGQKTYTSSRPYLALARCLVSQSEGEMASEAAKLAAARTDSKEESRYAEYISAAARQFPDDNTRATLEQGQDIWAALSEDHRAGLKLAEEIEKRKQ
ncbi:MAG: hypothetical protein VX127_14285 [Myxococcota bacterium]|nr:hypothetical protein [Myxococcota bacterium]